MISPILVYIGAGLIIIWGTAHIVATKPIADGFGQISGDNRKILVMEIIAEGLTLVFLGVLPLLVAVIGNAAGTVAKVVFFASAGMLLAMAALTALTGARTPAVPFKICPVVKTVVAALYILGALM